jgi:hypothetical protein
MADAIIAVPENKQDVLELFWCTKIKSKVIYNGSNLDEYKVTDTSALEQYQVDMSKPCEFFCW